MRIAALLLAVLLAQDPPARENASAFTFARPRGWTRQELPNKTVALRPAGDDANACGLFVFPGQNGQANELVYHDQMWQQFTPLCQIDKTEKAYRGSWQYTRAKILTPQKQNQWLALYTTRSGTHLEAILFASSSEDVFQKHRFAVERMITGIDFPDAKPVASGAPEWKPAPVPEKDKDVAIVGAWIVARMDMELGVQKHRVKIVALFENGVAAKLDAQRTGANDSTFPAEGLATLQVSNPGANDRRFGKWTEADGKIAITWNQGPEDAVQRAGENLKDAKGVIWSSMKPIDGVRLQKTYVREMPNGPPGMLVLRKDGSFDADQVNETMGGKLVNPKFPEMGSGTYEFRKWSLILRFDTGFVQSIHVMFDADDPAKAKQILVSEAAFATPGAVVPSGIVVHGLRIPVPADWIRNNQPGGGVYLVPPKEKNPNEIFLFVSPTQKMQGTHWEAHKAVLKAAIAWAQIKENGAVIQNVPVGPGFFVYSEVRGQIPTGQYRILRLYTAPHDGLMESITVANAADPDLRVLAAILEKTTFKDPPKEDRPRIVEVYRKVVQQTFNNPGDFGQTVGATQYTRLWLRADGTADFTSYYKEGYAASPDAPKIDGGLLNGAAGKWKAVGDKIEIQMSPNAPPVVYERVDGTLGEWELMPKVDGLKLSGRYSKKQLPAPGVTPYYHWIDFKEDGTFKADGAIRSVGFVDPDWPKLPEKCSGTYELRDWTIFFTLDDGRTWTTDCSTVSKDPKDLSGILLRTTKFTKE